MAVLPHSAALAVALPAVRQLRRKSSGSPQLLPHSRIRCFDDLVPFWRRLGCRTSFTGSVRSRSTRRPPDFSATRWNGISNAGTASRRGDHRRQAREREPALGPVVQHAISTATMGSRVRSPVDHQPASATIDGARRNRAPRRSPRGRGPNAEDRQMAARCRSTRSSSRPARGRGRLARSFGDRVLLESERGYNTTLRNPSVQLRAEVIFGERNSSPRRWPWAYGSAVPPSSLASKRLPTMLAAMPCCRWRPAICRVCEPRAARDGWVIGRRHRTPCLSSAVRHAGATCSTRSATAIPALRSGRRLGV